MRIPAAALAFVASVGAMPAPAVAQEGDLEQRLRIVERKLEAADEGREATGKEATTASAGEKGFGFRNADGSFEFKFKGLMQLDGRFFGDDEQTLNDTFLARRIEPSFELTLGKLAFFKLQPQFAGDSTTTADVYGELRFNPAAGLRFGKFKSPVGLETLQSSAPLSLVERGLPTEVGAGREVG